MGLTEPLFFHFYRQADCLTPDGRALDLGRIASLRPLESVKARPESVFRLHMHHLAFEISRRLPLLEGKLLDVALHFQGESGQPKMPVLVALYEGVAVGRKAARLETLNAAPFLSPLLRRRPDLRAEDLVFTVSPHNGAIS
jgi:hypothetical protein